jgi:chromosome segregation ATPase
LSEALDFPFPPTTGPSLAAPPTTPSAPPPVLAPSAPEVDELTRLREKVAELDHVISLAKTRVETLGAEKREALEHAMRLEAQLEAAQGREAQLLARIAAHEAASHEVPRTFDETIIAELLDRVATLETIIAPSRAA